MHADDVESVLAGKSLLDNNTIQGNNKISYCHAFYVYLLLLNIIFVVIVVKPPLNKI